jgi:predicted dithiol-disulfide oxidoreductase (DUF899 family)
LWKDEIMEHERRHGGLRQTRLPNESAEYLVRREELRLAEVELMRQRERVAALRRELRPATVVMDYLFEEGPANLDAGDTPVRTVSLSELFTGSNRSVIIYHFMYGKLQAEPCPMCSLLIDGLNGVAHHIAERVDLGIVAAADPSVLRAYARKRGWQRLRLLSAAKSTFKYDLNSEDAKGNQDSAISVFIRDSERRVRHFYTSHPWMAHDIHERGLDLLSPVWNLLDLTPQGRGDWYAKSDYEPTAQGAKYKNPER